MKYIIRITLSCLISTLCIGCVSNSAPGSASARINDGRNQRGAMVSDSDYAQQHRQRANEADEYAIRQRERQDQYESTVMPLKTFHDSLSQLGIRLGN